MFDAANTRLSCRAKHLPGIRWISMGVIFEKRASQESNTFSAITPTSKANKSPRERQGGFNNPHFNQWRKEGSVQPTVAEAAFSFLFSSSFWTHELLPPTKPWYCLWLWTTGWKKNDNSIIIADVNPNHPVHWAFITVLLHTLGESKKASGNKPQSNNAPLTTCNSPNQL